MDRPAGEVKADEEEKLLPKSTASLAVYRDQDRPRLFETTDTGNSQAVFESLRQGKQLVYVQPRWRKSFGRLQPSAQDELDQLSGSPCSPCYGIIDSEWIPDFLRMAKLSVHADTLEGRPLYRLRGLTMDAKIGVCIDPSFPTTLP